MVPFGKDFVCMNCKAFETQITVQEKSPTQNVGMLITSEIGTQSSSAPLQTVIQSKSTFTHLTNEQDVKPVQNKATSFDTEAPFLDLTLSIANASLHLKCKINGMILILKYLFRSLFVFRGYDLMLETSTTETNV